MDADRERTTTDPLDALLKALILTRATVAADSSAAARLDDIIESTTRLIDDVESDDNSWALVAPLLERFQRAVANG